MVQTKLDQNNQVKKVLGSCKAIFKVWLKFGRYPLKYKLGQMLHGQMLHGQMFPRQLTTHTDDLIKIGKIRLVSAEIFH